MVNLYVNLYHTVTRAKFDPFHYTTIYAVCRIGRTEDLNLMYPYSSYFDVAQITTLKPFQKYDKDVCSLIFKSKYRSILSFESEVCAKINWHEFTFSCRGVIMFTQMCCCTMVY